MGRRKRSPSPNSRRTKRFVFKSFAERVEAVDIDVFRRLDVVKFEPTQGTSFFHEALVQWRELNAAAHFVDLFVELLPMVQTLPQLLLHKDTVVKRLLETLEMPAVLSLEPILSLLAVLSRDLSADFQKYIPQIFEGFFNLLQQGGHKNSEVLEMVFTNVAYIFKYMQKFLLKNLVFVVKATKGLRLHPQDYVRSFAAEATSFLFRNAPLTQLIKGVRRVIAETEQHPSEESISASSALFTFMLKGPSHGFHSRAEEVLKLLLNPLILCGVGSERQGHVAVAILQQTFRNLCDEIHHGKIGPLWSCLLDEMQSAFLGLEMEATWTEKQESYVLKLLMLLNDSMEQKKSLASIGGNRSLLDVAPRLLSLVPKLCGEGHNEVLSQSFTFLLHSIKNQADTRIKMPVAASSWQQAFECTPVLRLLPFIEGLAGQDVETCRPFVDLVLRALESGIGTSEREIFPVLLLVLQKCGSRHVESPKLAAFAGSLVEASLERLKSGEHTLVEADMVRTALQCLPYLVKGYSLSLDYAAAVDRCLDTNKESNVEDWMRLLGTSLQSHMEAAGYQSEAFRFLSFGLKYPRSCDVLEVVAQCIAATSRSIDAANIPVELNHHSLLKDCKTFANNLGMPSKKMRQTTLKILSLYEQTDQSKQVLQDLLAIESMPLDVESSRRVGLLISKLKTNVLSVGDELLRVVFHALVGVLQNRLTTVWSPAIDFLVELLGDHRTLVDEFISYLSSTQDECLAPKKLDTDKGDSELTTPVSSLMTSLLRIAQKGAPALSSKSGQIVSLFLTFIEHKDRPESSFSGKDWSIVLKNWLQLLGQLKGISGLSNSSLLKETLTDRFLIFNDPDVQKKAFDCLLIWKDKHLTAYKEHLYSLISANTYRDELTNWSIARGEGQVSDEHRPYLIPVLLRILYPKLSKRNSKIGTSAGALIRSSVLTFLSALDVKELSFLFVLIMRPLEAAFTQEGMLKDDADQPAWSAALQRNETTSFIDLVDKKGLAEVPYKRKIGFLHLMPEVIEALDAEHLEPYLPAIVGMIVRILESSSFDPEAADKDESSKGFSDKDLRVLCLRTISLVLGTFQNLSLGMQYWESFFRATEHSITFMKDENAHGSRPSALLSCIIELSKDEQLSCLLQTNKLLVPNIFSVLHCEKLSVPVHTAVLSFVENLLRMARETVNSVLLPHIGVLLHGLTVQLTKKNPTSRDKKARVLLQQHLHILSNLSELIDDSSRATAFLDTLLPFLKVKKFMDAEIVTETLKILRDLAVHFDNASISKCVQSFAPLLTMLTHRDARTLICECLEKFSHVDHSLASVARVLVELNSMSASRVDECDYDRRQAAYGALNVSFFSELECSQTFLLLSHAIFDLESEDMRYNASSCLLFFVKAAGGGALTENVKTASLDFLFNRIVDAMQSEDSALRREWLIIFRELVSTSETAFMQYHCLLSSDTEVDFFNNIVHVQVHRRIKAMARFRAACIDGHFSELALKKLFVPLFLHSLFEVRAKDGNLVDATIETMGCIGAHLPLKTGVGLVLDIFRMLGKNAENQKVLVRLICSVLDKVQGCWSKESEGGEMPVKVLENKVLPQLNKLMMVEESVNVPVALATVKVLQLMPEDVISKHLPRICQTITNLLKNRLQETRDPARSAIVGMVEILGARYIQFVVKTLQASLKRGFEKHVLGYTVNAILIRAVPLLSVGELDHCLEDLLPIVEDEIFGEVSAEKEVEALAKQMKERKETRSYDTVRLIAQVMTFDDGMQKFLSMIKQQKSLSSATQEQEKVQLILKNLAGGLKGNASASDERIISFVRELLVEFVAQNGQAPRVAGENESSSYNMHLIAEFGLNLLFSRVKGKQVDSEQLMALDSYVELLHKCLCMKYDGVISGALKCLSVLLKLALPSISAVGEDIVNRVFFLAGKSLRSDSPLMQACIKLQMVLLRHCKNVKVTQAQVHELLRLNIFVDIENQSTQALTLLKALVDRKLLVPELYDLMNRVQKMMITSQLPAIRQRCSEILLQFLLDYPLGPKRLQQHFDFLIANLEYEHVSGREAALEMLHTMIVKFPDVVIEEQAEFLFLTFTNRLANDTDGSVQLMLEAAVKVLMGRVSAQLVDRFKIFLLAWINPALDDNPALWKPTIQGTRLLAEALDIKFERYFDEFWPGVLKILTREKEPGTAPWKETHQALLLLERFCESFPDKLYSCCTEETWSIVQGYLLHRHVSVRKAASRLAATYIARTSSGRRSDIRFKFLLLAAVFCEQMASEKTDEELGAQAVENLTSVAQVLSSTVVRTEDLQDDRVKKALSLLVGGNEARLAKIFEKEEKSGLGLVFRRLEKIGVEQVQMKTVLTWYPSVLKHLGVQASVPYLPSILSPLCKVERSTAADDLKTFAVGVRDEIRELVGAEKFAAAYNQVVQGVKARNENRKRAASIAALVDPEKNARKKMKIGQKKGAQKKRKRNESNK